MVGMKLVRENQMCLARQQAVGRAVEVEGTSRVQVDYENVACVQAAFEAAPLQVPACPAHECQ